MPPIKEIGAPSEALRLLRNENNRLRAAMADMRDAEIIRLRAALDEVIDFRMGDHESVAGVVSEIKAVARRALMHEESSPE